MSQKKSARKIRSFAVNLYDYIWTKHNFTSQTLVKYLTTNLCLQIERTEEGKSTHFNETIGKAVLCSQYLLRQFCSDFFTCMGKCMVQSRYFFRFYIYFILYKWIRYRSNVFTKVLDCCAIIAEAILFLESKIEICEEINLAPEIFFEFFECNLAAEFFEKGGWEQLAKKAADDYFYLYLILEDIIDSVNPPYATFIYDHNLIDALRDSSVMFPVCYTEMCESNVEIIEGEKTHHISYDRSLAEIFEQSSADKLVPSFNTEYLNKNKNSSFEDLNENNESPETDFVYVFVGEDDFVESCNLADGKLSSKRRKKRKPKKLFVK